MTGIVCSIAGATYAAPVVNAAVALDGTNDYFVSSSYSSSVTDSRYCCIAMTFLWDSSGGNLQHLCNLQLGASGSGGQSSWRMWVNGGRIQITFKNVTDGGDTGSYYEQAENSLNSGAWNHIMLWLDTQSKANSRIYVNGTSRTIDSGSSQPGGTFNWANTQSYLNIGRQNPVLGGDGSDHYLKGKVSQLWINNNSSDPGISSFYDTGASKPKDLGTQGTATGLARPLIYHYGTLSTFTTNNGTGLGSYTLTATNGPTDTTGPTYA